MFQKGNKLCVGRLPWNKGKKGIHLSPKSEFKKGHISTKGSLGKHWEIKDTSKMSKSHLGRKLPEQSGENHWRWIIDRTKLSRISKQGERRTSIYFDWRKRVWERDNWKCRINNSDCKGRIESHHILGWSSYPELRYNINNGITLCHAHHPRKRAEEKQLAPIFQELIAIK